MASYNPVPAHLQTPPGFHSYGTQRNQAPFAQTGPAHGPKDTDTAALEVINIGSPLKELDAEIS